MNTRIKETYKRSQKRKTNRVFNNIIELIEILSSDFLKKYHTLTLATPFENEIKIGKFDNSGNKPLQLKIFTNGGIEQARAADSFFFVTICENFRTPGAVKYMRSCLRHLIKNNLTFNQEFGSNLGNTICTLTPKGGTKITKNCLQNGDMSKLSSEQKEPYDCLSSASEDDNIITRKHKR